MGEQYLSTSRLANVMRLITLGRQTGLLRVVRGQGPTREEGEIQFIDGQVARATVGQITGGAALQVLQNWGESYYLFLDGVNILMGGYPSDSLGWAAPPSSGSLPPAGSGSLPNGMFNTSQPGMMPLPDYGPPSGSMSGTPSDHAVRSLYNTGAMPYGRQQVAQRVLDIGYIPRRLAALNQAETAALDRRERQLLLLVDGRRTIADLIRLTRRGDDEIRMILTNLITQRLVE